MHRQPLDSLNLRILEELQEDGRISNQELAERVALSPSACLARLRKLEAEGIVARYRADLDLDRLEHVVEAFIEVQLANHERGELTRFEQAMVAHPHVVSCHRVSGQFDCMLYVVAQDMQQLRQVADDLLAGRLGVAKINTIPVLATIKRFTGYPLRRLLDEASR
jgi:Lrp/AsnC family leucine-responsive transcriptional regulator